MTQPVQSPDEESVGPEFGLEPRLPRAQLLPPLSSRSLIATDGYATGSEFGGVAGLIQPEPHVPSASERLHMIYAIDPTDDGSRSDGIAPPDLTGAFNSRP